MNLPEEQREKFCERVRSPSLALLQKRRIAWTLTFLQKSDKLRTDFSYYLRKCWVTQWNATQRISRVYSGVKT
jgi:hypothetical protein